METEPEPGKGKDIREAILTFLAKNPNTPFSPNEIAKNLKEENLKVNYLKVLKILLEELTKNQNLRYKRLGKIYLFWLKA